MAKKSKNETQPAELETDATESTEVQALEVETTPEQVTGQAEEPEPAPNASRGILARIEALEAHFKQERIEKREAVGRADALKARFDEVMLEVQKLVPQPFDDGHLVADLNALKVRLDDGINENKASINEAQAANSNSISEEKTARLKQIEELDGKVAKKADLESLQNLARKVEGLAPSASEPGDLEARILALEATVGGS